ncbi:MAG: VWA domain-containing protein [Acidobacteriota bacterium]
MSRKTGLIAASLFLIIGLFLSAQSGHPVRVRVDLVPVTVVVTDEQGKPLRGLGRDDFSVFENGAKQQVSHFQILTSDQSLTSPAPDRQIAERAGFPDGQHRRSFLILLGRGRYAQAFDEIRDFILGKLRPDDRVAIVAHGYATSFSNDHSSVAAILKRCHAGWDAIEQKLEQASRSELAIVYGDPLGVPVECLVREMLGECRRILPPRPGADRLERRKADRQVVEYEEQAIMQKRMDRTPIPANNEKYRQFDRIRSERIRYGTAPSAFLAHRAATEEDLQCLFASVDYLKTAPGDRHMLFLTTRGLVLPGLSNPDVPGNIASLAGDGAVRIHTLYVGESSEAGQASSAEKNAQYLERSASLAQSRGSASGATASRSEAVTPQRYALSDLGFSALASMKDLSELTGGQAFVGADVPQALSAISDSAASLYLLGYTPTDQRLDGRYRKIRVEVSARNARVFCRRGYYATPLPPSVEMQRSYLRTIAGLTSPRPLDDIRVALGRVTSAANQEGRGLTFEVTVQVRADMFETSAERFTGTFSLAYFLVAEEQKVVAQAWDTVDMNLKEATYRQVLQAGLKVAGNLPQPTGARRGRVKAVVYSPQSDLLGSAERKWNE